jgi:hypothetical protein
VDPNAAARISLLPKFKKFEVKDWIVHREHLYRKRPYLSVLQQSVTSLS